MEMDENEIVKFVEPIFHFCAKRLSSRHDAEDLASEIMVHVLSGIKKYQIDSLEKWVWRIARNRYARFIDMRKRQNEVPPENDFADIKDDYDFVDELIVVDRYQQVFKYLHTLSSEYRNILVDYYIGQLPVKQIAKAYALTETTVKWRLNVSREKIKTRIGENKMDKVYKRINWNTGTCNGSMDPNKYLYSQIARAICEAAYEKPLTVEEISIKTGLPTMYIEDELPRLVGGDAIFQDGGKYAANFIILRLCDKRAMETKFAPLVANVADYFASLFKEHEDAVSSMGFYGSDFSMKRLGYIALPAVLRGKIGKIKDGLNMPNGPYPPRLDGGYGWFVVDEKETENEALATTESGCNSNGDEAKGNFIYYYWIGKYFDNKVYHNGGTKWLAPKDIVGKSQDGTIPDGSLSEDDIVRLIAANLIVKDGGEYKFNFAIFAKEQFEDFKGRFDKDNANL
ncbi:MAG: sigma-70 family RNA polymerase sigma factor, partial [Oscillospiraceae bacterium]|nr:sigma-70 family RNA polymerase sigma factor [Oscillospiraceae bacterium]